MKTTNRLICLFAALLTTATLMAEVVYEPLIVASGFNRDVIAECYPLNSSCVISYLQETGYYYSMATESVIRSVNNAYQETDPGYFSDANLVDIPKQGWPDDYRDTIKCVEDAKDDPLYKDVFFMLAPYDQPNVLTIRPDNAIGGTGTLKFKKVGCYNKVFFLLASAFEGSRPSVRNVSTTIYYTDGSSENSIFEFAGLSGKTGHNVRKINIYEYKYKKWSKNDANKAYAAIFDMDVDATKLVDRIEFRNTINQTAVMIFAVTGRTANIAAPDEEAAEVSNIQNNSFEACWDAIADAASYRLDVAEDIDFQHLVEGYNNLNVGNNTCQQVANLLADNDYYWRVRSVNADGGQSASSAPHRVKTAGGTPPETAEEHPNIAEEIAPHVDASYSTFKIYRTLWRDGYYNTLCLPFNMTADEIDASPLTGATVYEYDGAEAIGNNQLNIAVRETDHITAGVPYLIKWPNMGDIIGNPLEFHNVTIRTNEGQIIGGENEIKFVGNIATAAMTNGDHNSLFLGANNTLYWPNTDLGLKGFRAHFEIPTTGAQAVARNTPARIVMQNQTTTDVESIQPSDIRVQKVLRNGQLYLMYNGTVYNVQGQEVK